MFKKTVDGILSSINKNIADLSRFSDAQRALADHESEKAVQLQQSASDRKVEALRAESVAKKLTDLVSA